MSTHSSALNLSHGLPLLRTTSRNLHTDLRFRLLTNSYDTPFNFPCAEIDSSALRRDASQHILTLYTRQAESVMCLFQKMFP